MYNKAAFAATQIPLDTNIEVHEGIMACADCHARHGNAFEKLAGYHLICHVAIDTETVGQTSIDAAAATNQRRTRLDGKVSGYASACEYDGIPFALRTIGAYQVMDIE